MTNLSPVAQAVLDATDYPEDWATRIRVAAALRAAADEVAPFPGRYPMNEYMEGFREAKQSVYHQLLAIAGELEGIAAELEGAGA
jgi:hypothetical protein